MSNMFQLYLTASFITIKYIYHQLDQRTQLKNRTREKKQINSNVFKILNYTNRSTLVVPAATNGCSNLISAVF